MAHEVILPKLGTNIEYGMILEWKKKEGEPVKKGEALLVVETSKAVFDVESEYDGFLRKVFRGEGENVCFTEPVGVLTEDREESIAGLLKERAEPAPKPKRHHEKKREELIGVHTDGAAKGVQRHARYAATPAAKRLSGELKINLEKVAYAFGAQVVDEKLILEYRGRKKLAIYGAGLGAKQAKELLRQRDDLVVVGLFDDNPKIKDSEMIGLKVMGGWNEFMDMATGNEVDSVAVSLHSEYRRKLINKIAKEAPFIELLPLVDPRAIVSDKVVIMPGAFIEAGSVIGPDTFIGDGVIVDVGAIVSHDCHIGAHSHLSPGCVLSGIVRLEENVLVGVGASINSQVTIGRNVVITPGSAVVCDIPDDAVVSGNPAKIIGKSYRGA